MTYKLCCPRCGTKVSRWQLCTTLALQYRCRQCDARFRVNTAGWIGTGIVVGLQILWFILAERYVISGSAAIMLLLATCALALWFFPYFSSAVVDR